MSRHLFALVLFLLFLAGCLAWAGRAPAARAQQPDGGSPAAQSIVAYGPWEIITVDSQNNVGRFLSMGVRSSTKTPTIAYYDATAGDLKVAQLGAGNCGPENSWTCAVVDSTSSNDVGQHVSLAFRDSNSYGVAYYDAVNHVNRYSIPGAGIHGEIIEHVQGEEVGTFNALTYDTSGAAHVVYNRNIPGGVGFGYAKRVGSGGSCTPPWNCQSLQNYAGFMSIDNTVYGGIGVSYVGLGGFLGFAHPVGNGGNCGGGAWQCDNLESASALGTSLLMARCGLLSCSTQTQIAYYNQTTGQLKYASYTGNGLGNCSLNNNWNCWVIESVGQTAGFNGIGLSMVLVGNQQVIIYQDLDDQANSIVKMAWPVIGGGCGPGNNWHCTVIDDGARGPGFVSVGAALDAVVIDGRIHVAYYEANHGDLLVAYEPVPEAPQQQLFIPLVKR